MLLGTSNRCQHCVLFGSADFRVSCACCSSHVVVLCLILLAGSFACYQSLVLSLVVINLFFFFFVSTRTSAQDAHRNKEEYCVPKLGETVNPTTTETVGHYYLGFIVIHELIDRGDAGLSVGTQFLMVLKRTACPSRVLRSPGR